MYIYVQPWPVLWALDPESPCELHDFNWWLEPLQVQYLQHNLLIPSSTPIIHSCTSQIFKSHLWHLLPYPQYLICQKISTLEYLLNQFSFPHVHWYHCFPDFCVMLLQYFLNWSSQFYYVPLQTVFCFTKVAARWHISSCVSHLHSLFNSLNAFPFLLGHRSRPLTRLTKPWVECSLSSPTSSSDCPHPDSRHFGFSFSLSKTHVSFCYKSLTYLLFLPESVPLASFLSVYKIFS